MELKDGVLSVRDHGPGFEEADLPFVFDRFYRADDARKLPGSGLGLAIVRQAAEASGGFVEAQNAPGGGALLRVGFGARWSSRRPLRRISRGRRSQPAARGALRRAVASLQSRATLVEQRRIAPEASSVKDSPRTVVITPVAHRNFCVGGVPEG